jgi:hypothetical protein
MQLAFAHVMGWSWTGILTAALPPVSTMLFFANRNGRVPFLHRRNNNNGGSGLLFGLTIGLTIFLFWTNFWLTVWWLIVCVVAVRFFGVGPNLLNWSSVAVFGAVTLVIAWIVRQVQRRCVDRTVNRAIESCTDRVVDSLLFLAKQPFVWTWKTLKWTVLGGFVPLLVWTLRGLKWTANHLFDGFLALVMQLFVWTWKALKWTVLSTFSRHQNEHGEATYYDDFTPIVTAGEPPATLRRSARIRKLKPVDYNAVRIDYSMGTR